MFDRFSIDVRSIFDKCSTIGGGLEEHSRMGGLDDDQRRVGDDLEKAWRRIGAGLEGGLEEDWRSEG